MVQPNGIQGILRTDTYLNVAETFVYRSTCIKRKYGAVIVRDDVVVSTGYNGLPRGYDSCCDARKCPKIELGMHQGERYGTCRVVHVRRNALLSCSREQTMGADLYPAGANPMDNPVHRTKPYPSCARMIIQAGVRSVIMRMGARADEYVTASVGGLAWHRWIQAGDLGRGFGLRIRSGIFCIDGGAGKRYTGLWLK